MNQHTSQAVILYFSGTGNTAFIAAQLSEALQKHGVDAKTMPIETVDYAAVAAADLLLFGFPVYGARMPRFLQRHLSDLPRPASGRIYLFATYGLYPGNALRKASLRCARLGFLPAGAAEFKLPGSDGLAFLPKESRRARKAEETDFHHRPRIEENIEILAQAAASSAGTPPPEGSEAAGEFAAGLSAYRRRSRLIDLLLKGALKGMEQNLRRRLYADESCSRYGTCVAVCPTGAVTMPSRGTPRFSERCILCMRCVHQCPEEAIQIGTRSAGKFRWKGPDGTYRAPRLR